jgi:hypothetical protein
MVEIDPVEREYDSVNDVARVLKGPDYGPGPPDHAFVRTALLTA